MSYGRQSSSAPCTSGTSLVQSTIVATAKTGNPSSCVLALEKELSNSTTGMSTLLKVKNILDLTELCKNIRFFPGDIDQGVLSVIRCETCFNYLKSKRIKPSDKLSLAQVAKKGIGGYSGSLSTGLPTTPKKAVLYLEGGNKEFYKLKNTVKNHITLAGGQAQTHYEALQYEYRKRMECGVAVTQNLVSIAITVVKAKSAAIHYETMIAAHAFTGSDVGEFGHSRKQFNEILRCAEVWCNREIAKFLCKPLPSTRLPPHYYITCDKTMPTRLTNQAVMVCPVINGKREAIAVNSSEVYHEANNEVEGDVSGSTAAEWARMVYDEIKKAYPAIDDKIIQGSWTGTVCDGVYQLDQSIFFSVLWDSAHFSRFSVF
ncbi:Hypothetical predicted protein [Paramuricea clavata]|uniref:Uncharacterized protein n=1 Tax=Paramuricea clavata TaxID=317549 RepID=A0A6S7G8H7_PARCT|nr:Hypothetical predicted protein [Paramuricea clavata]